MGLDWADQVAAIRKAGVNGTVYTTWLEAPSQGAAVQRIPPIEYLAQLAAQSGLPLAGENAGGGGTAALALCVQRANALGLQGIMYFAGPFVADGSAGVSLANLTSAAAYC